MLSNLQCNSDNGYYAFKPSVLHYVLPTIADILLIFYTLHSSFPVRCIMVGSTDTSNVVPIVSDTLVRHAYWTQYLFFLCTC